MKIIQNNKCAICGNIFSDRRHTQIDHCHKTKKIRGLLCIQCNSGIGMLKEDVDILKKAIDYINFYKIKE